MHDLVPYVPGEQPKWDRVIKLNTNENPYGPSPRVLEAIRKGVDDTLRLYPDPEAMDLKRAIADYYGLEPQQVFVGNGSDEVLAHIFYALFQHDRPLLFPDITYSFYPVYCRLYQIAYRTIALDEQLHIDISQYPADNAGIIFPNPNAPTGRLLLLDEIDALLQRNTDSVVVIDEAYIDFGGESAVTLIAKYPNLLVTQTFSKSRSLAGLRIGFALGNSTLIEALTRVKDSFNSYPLDRLAISAGVAAIKDEHYFIRTCEQVINSRQSMIRALHTLGFEVLPSAANFVFMRHPAHSAAHIVDQLRQQGVIVRHFSQARIEDYLRVTVGTKEENQRFLAILDTLV